MHSTSVGPTLGAIEYARVRVEPEEQLQTTARWTSALFEIDIGFERHRALPITA